MSSLTDWSVRIAVTKIIKRAIQLAVAWTVGHNLDRFGIKIDPVTLSGSVYLGAEFIRGLLKRKFGLNWL